MVANNTFTFIMVANNTFTFKMVANITFTFIMVANNTFTFLMVANNTFIFITILSTFIIVAKTLSLSFLASLWQVCLTWLDYLSLRLQPRSLLLLLPLLKGYPATVVHTSGFFLSANWQDTVTISAIDSHEIPVNLFYQVMELMQMDE